MEALSFPKAKSRIFTGCQLIMRKTLYQVARTYLRKAPVDEPVYQFLDKKRAEGKPYFVYMTAAQNKCLHIYYARVKECLIDDDTKGLSEN